MSAASSTLPHRGAISGSVIDGLPTPVVITTTNDDSVVRVNPEFTHAYGHDTRGVQGIPFGELHFVASDRQDALESHAAGNIDAVKVRLLSSAGECRWAQADIARFSLEDGRDVLLTVLHDISRQELAEQELAERARFPAMNPGPVARLDADGVVIRANPAASKLFGRESIAGESWLELCPGIDAALWSRARSSDDSVHYDAEIGTVCYTFTLRHEPVADQVFIYGSDITELKSAQRALAELARFPEMNPGPVCRLDRKGIVLLANQAARAVFGSENLTGRRWLDLVPSVDETLWQRVLAAPRPIAVEANLGERHFVLTHAPGPEGIFVFVYGSDITREKEAERALRQSEKMATLGTLAAGVAHELNNPAAAAQRAAEQLRESFAAMQRARTALADLPESAKDSALRDELEAQAREAVGCPCDLDPVARSDLEAELEEWLEDRGSEDPWDTASSLVELGQDSGSLDRLAERVGPEAAARLAAWQGHAYRVYRLLDEIRHGAGRLVEIVGAMKDYSYLGQGEAQSVDVNEGIRNTLIILRSKLKGGIRVKQDLSPDLPRIEALGGELNQVWTNLLDNAADAMDGQGEIHLRSMLVEDRVIVEVEDDGPGIPEADQSRVFDAFFTTKPPGKGTGLGLNTVYNIVVAKHGGSIQVDSSPGRTQFTVALPTRRPRSMGATEKPPTNRERSA